MVIKTLRWKTRGFNRLADYIGKEGRDEDETFRVLHNLRPSRNLTGLAGQFWAQDVYRKVRKNGVVVYHEIMSFKRGEEVSLDALEDLAREYIELRAPNALVYAEPHFDTDHVHIHFMISGSEFESSKTLRLNNDEFMQVRREIEGYQKEHYPELKSLVYQDRYRERIEELEAIQKSKADRHLEREQTPEEAYLADIPEPTEAIDTTARAEAEAVAAMEAEQQMQIDEENRAEAERQAEEAARIQELEAIQDEQRCRSEQERGRD